MAKACVVVTDATWSVPRLSHPGILGMVWDGLGIMDVEEVGVHIAFVILIYRYIFCRIASVLVSVAFVGLVSRWV